MRVAKAYKRRLAYSVTVRILAFNKFITSIHKPERIKFVCVGTYVFLSDGCLLR